VKDVVCPDPELKQQQRFICPVAHL